VSPALPLTSAICGFPLLGQEIARSQAKAAPGQTTLPVLFHDRVQEAKRALDEEAEALSARMRGLLQEWPRDGGDLEQEFGLRVADAMQRFMKCLHGFHIGSGGASSAVWVKEVHKRHLESEPSVLLSKAEKIRETVSLSYDQMQKLQITQHIFSVKLVEIVNKRVRE